jgi:AAA domain, putative AbiEii toxin, Type IV TA system
LIILAKIPSAFVKHVVFSGGEQFSFSSEDKVIVVGANNCGKSQFLRDVSQAASNANKNLTLSIGSISFDKIGSMQDLESFISKNAKLIDGHLQYRGMIIQGFTVGAWDGENFMLQVHNLFLKLISTSDRLWICNTQSSIARDAALVNPQQIMFFDNDILQRINDLFKVAFDKELMFDRQGGATIPLHVGKRPQNYSSQSLGFDYNNAVIKFPTLEKQGDGIKSYLGILLETIVTEYSINLIDEPESFLHPPQMRKLGQTLSKEVTGQLFVATHSSDILRGFLSGTTGNLRILRINRVGDKNHVTEASQDKVTELWSNPVLRYSNALEGIFHEQTIICEDDSDCRLINSIADHLEVEDAKKWSDTAYVPSGGKHAIPKIAELLRAIGVPVKAVFDIDFLSEEALVEKTVSAFGGDWSRCSNSKQENTKKQRRNKD